MNKNIIYEYKTVTCEKLTKYIIDNKPLHKYFKQDWEKLKSKYFIYMLILQIFFKNLFKEFQKETYKEYIPEQDNLTTLRGKYLINENLKDNFTNSKIYCEYDECGDEMKNRMKEL